MGRPYVLAQQAIQGAHFQRTVADHAGYMGAAYRLAPAELELNLAPSLRGVAAKYFARPEGKISWHTHASHGLSSQVCCLNFLMPLATRPDVLSTLVGRVLGIAPPLMLPVEDGPDGAPWFVGFEWIGELDYLNEAGANGVRTRGANATSSDAILRFQHEGQTEILLIEWKYTEAYGAPIPNKARPDAKRTPNQVRAARYGDLAFAPSGPIRNDLGLALEDFFWEPFYQCLRQQMLAWEMQKHLELGAERVRVLHISPSGNTALHKVTAPALVRFGDDAFEVFRSVLVDPSAFISISIEQAFRSCLADLGTDDPWAEYLLARYRFLSRDAAQAEL